MAYRLMLYTVPGCENEIKLILVKPPCERFIFNPSDPDKQYIMGNENNVVPMKRKVEMEM